MKKIAKLSKPTKLPKKKNPGCDRRVKTENDGPNDGRDDDGVLQSDFGVQIRSFVFFS